MNKAFIWDLDGTLFDSYPIYVSSLQAALKEFGVEAEQKLILEDVITYTIGHFIDRAASDYGVDKDAYKRRYMEIASVRNFEIQPMTHAKELLDLLRDRGDRNFVYTHKDKSAIDVLDKMGLLPYFDEVVTGDDGFKRKPEPDAVSYLLEKYQLDPERTYYVGDRTLDIDCGWNAGTKSIFFILPDSCAQPNGHETHIVHDLLDIAEITK